MLRESLFVVRERLSSRHFMVGCDRKNRLVLAINWWLDRRRGRCGRSLRGGYGGKGGGRTGRLACGVVLTGILLEIEFELRIAFTGSCSIVKLAQSAKLPFVNG